MLEIKKLQYQYKKPSNFDFSLKLDPGDSLSIIGPNGAGKSTLINLIAGFLTKTQGKIIFNKQDISFLPPKDRPVSILFKDNNTFEHLNIFNNIAIGISPNMKLTSVEKDLVEYALTQVGLEGFNNRFPYQLSNGQQQKVAIARAMVRNKPILLIDEAFASFDPPTRLEMLDLISIMQKNTDLITLIVTLNYTNTLSICNKACFVHDGKIIYINSTKQFTEETKSPMIKAYTQLH